MQQRRILTAVRRGDNFLGRVVDPGNQRTLVLEIVHNDKVIRTEEVANDQEEAEMSLAHLMDKTFREINGKVTSPTKRAF